MRSRLSHSPATAPPAPSFPQCAPARSRNFAHRPRRARSIPASPRPPVAAAAHRRRARNKSCACRWGTRAHAAFRPRRAGRSRCLPGPLALLDQLPKFAVLAELVVFRHRKFAAEKEITKRVLVQDAVDPDALRRPLEIDSIFLRAITMQLLPFALDYAEAAGVEIVEVLGKDLEFRQQIELQRFRQRRHFRGAQLVEDDLEHLTHTYTRRTRLPIRVMISHVIVSARSASSVVEISSSPWRPIKTTSSPTAASLICETSIIIRSIVTRPSSGQRFPRTSTAASRFDRWRG